MILAKNIKNIRIKKAITPTQMAKLLQLQDDYYLSIEGGVCYPSFNCVDKISDIFNVSIATILTGSEKYNDLSKLKLYKESAFYLWAYKFLYNKRKVASYKYCASLFTTLNYALVEFGDKPLERITLDDIQNLFFKLATNKSKKTIKDCRSAIKLVFEFAISLRAYDFNPVVFSAIPINAKEKVITQPISENTRLVITRNSHYLQAGAAIMMLSGLRRGEMLALRWNDININEQYLIVDKSISMINGLPHLKPGAKTPAGTRRVDFPDDLAVCLMEYVSEYKIKNKNRLIFANSEGLYSGERYWQKSWKNYINFLRSDPMFVEEFTSKQLRHYFCTLLYKAGVDVLTARDLMGHRDVRTTMQIYTHLDKIYKKKDVSKVNNYLCHTNPLPDAI